MRNKIYSSLDSWGRNLIAGMLSLASVLVSGPAVAQPAGVGEVPVLFDARERLPRPDLSALIRLRFLTTTDFAPFNFTDQTGRLAGFHIDLVRAICAELQIEAKCQIQAMPYGDLQPALSSGQGEAVIAGIAVTDQLRREFLFSRPYMLLPARFVRLNGVSFDGSDANALSGRPVGVVGGTAHEAMLKSFFPQIRAVAFSSRTAMLEGLRKREVEAVFADALQLSFWANSPASENCCALFDGPYMSERFLGEGLTIMMRRQDSALAEALDSALAALSRNGRLQEIYLRYFPYGLF
ncbi:transporter substrate-binding domain-containing protein [Rhizobium sp. RU36D]|uniref:transporter substrate-binding domain-containing protein n=1 Tax=Rhizobium sp. RU36D TaxID=1907415 RepID=UPI0009D8D037|nr:transporter substrate-binding domain-containing protein [Rhizobium sp. RU36D]SMD18903.1 amino acid ABC transporter substrate-binding protein, PAAT family [Rhizobium sp. RU36D]